MELREAIAALEKYYGETSEEFYSDEMLLLQERVIQAFSFTEEELEQALSAHPDYAFVKYSEIAYWEDYETNRCGHDICHRYEKNFYISAVVPRLIADIFSGYFQEARFYKTWTDLDNDARKQGLSKYTSIEFVSKVLHQVESSGHGCRIKDIVQSEDITLTASCSSSELDNSSRDLEPLVSFVDDGNGDKKFQFEFPLLEDVLMPIAEERFRAKLERKRKNPQE